jgi:hypothetical protein
MVNVDDLLRKIYVNGDLVAVTNKSYPYYSNQLILIIVFQLQENQVITIIKD